MEYDQQQPVYEAPRPTPPILWMGLTALFALCCCFFFLVSAGEAVLLMTGATLGTPGGATPTPSAAQPSLGDVKFYLGQTASGDPLGTAVKTVPSGTKAIFAYFTYKNMPRSGITWSYAWTLDGVDLPTADKSGLNWTRAGNGSYFVKLADDKGLKAGVYEVTIDVGDNEQVASITVGP
jgi:hypothetical protein